MKKPTKDSDMQTLLRAILFMSSDKRTRAMLVDEVDWLNEKMKEIRRLARLAIKKNKAPGGASK